MKNKGKFNIICLILLIAVIACVIVFCNKGEEEQSSALENGAKVISAEEALNIGTNRVKEKLEENDYYVQEGGSARTSLGTSNGVKLIAYKSGVSEVNKENGVEIEVFQIDSNFIRKLGNDVSNTEVSIDGETFIRYENVLIKCSDTNDYNIIKTIFAK